MQIFYCVFYFETFSFFLSPYRPGTCERDVSHSSWESLWDCWCWWEGVDQSHWKRGNTHTHTLAVAGMWMDLLIQCSAPCHSDPGWQGKIVVLDEVCESGNRSRLGPKQRHGRVSAYFLKLLLCQVSVQWSVCGCRQDARRRRQFRDHTGNRITLEAVLNTTCTKCGCKGIIRKGWSHAILHSCFTHISYILTLFRSLYKGLLLHSGLTVRSFAWRGRWRTTAAAAAAADFHS